MADSSALAPSRYERKYLTTDYTAEQLENFILTHPGAFHPQYYPRRVISIYFDTPQNDYYQQNFLGHAQRKKVRVRWYQPQGKTDAIFLEVKARDGEVMQKHTDRIEGLTSTSTLKDITAAVQQTLQTVLPEAEMLQPILAVSYLRRYFADRQDIRLTIDSDVQFATINDWETKRITQHLPATIVECKYPVADDPKLSHVMQGLPLRISRSSKYVMGMQQCHPDIMGH